MREKPVIIGVGEDCCCLKVGEKVGRPPVHLRFDSPRPVSLFGCGMTSPASKAVAAMSILQRQRRGGKEIPGSPGK